MRFKAGRDYYELVDYEVTQFDSHALHIKMYAEHIELGVLITGNIHVPYNVINRFRNRAMYVSNDCTKAFAEELERKLFNGEQFDLKELKDHYAKIATKTAKEKGCENATIHLQVDVNAKEVKELKKIMREIRKNVPYTRTFLTY